MHRKLRRQLWLAAAGVLVVALLILNSAPANFPINQSITIPAGASLSEISQTLSQLSVIRSSLFFRLVAKVVGGESKIKAGDYWFEGKLGAFEIAKRLTQGQFSTDPIKVTIPEGLSAKEIGALLAKVGLLRFDETKFNALATKEEGKLFPDTYFIPPFAGAREIVKQMRSDFNTQIVVKMPEINLSHRSLDQILTMASLLEKEANDDDTRRLIAGILWKRFDTGMLLQTDATFPYFLGKNSLEVSLADLKNTSPYNTYRFKGLPPTPINNPGLEAIGAALEPTPSPYWFYLSGRDSVMHYAKNFDEHKSNKARYLN